MLRIAERFSLASSSLVALPWSRALVRFLVGASRWGLFPVPVL
jgi:hypothetical protein